MYIRFRIVNLQVREYGYNTSLYIATKDRHLKKLRSMEKLHPLKNERKEENPIKLESAKKLTSLARFGSCIFAPIAPSRSYPGKQARKSRLELHPDDGVCSFSSLSLSLTCHVV